HDRLDDGTRRVAQDERSPGHHIVHEGVAVRVVDFGSPGAGDEMGEGPDRFEGTDRAVHPAGQHPQRGFEELLGGSGFHTEKYRTLTWAPQCVKQGFSATILPA